MPESKQHIAGRLEGKRAVITGAASGIGRATAQLFAAEGAQVIASDLDAAGLEQTCADAPAALRAHVANASDDAEVRSLIEAAQRELGGLDIVYANAGISGNLAPFWDLEVADWRSVLEVNLVGAFLAFKYGSRALREGGGGALLATASVAGLRSGAGPTPYSASKAGVISLVQTAAYQLSGSGIRVNAICPGLTESGMTKPIFDGARARGTEDKIGQLNPLQRAAQPHEIAATALFLASDEASYVNGQALPVCGGLSASHPVVPAHLA